MCCAKNVPVISVRGNIYFGAEAIDALKSRRSEINDRDVRCHQNWLTSMPLKTNSWPLVSRSRLVWVALENTQLHVWVVTASCLQARRQSTLRDLFPSGSSFPWLFAVSRIWAYLPRSRWCNLTFCWTKTRRYLTLSITSIWPGLGILFPLERFALYRPGNDGGLRISADHLFHQTVRALDWKCGISQNGSRQ